jgi:hypothetical protein
MTVWLMRHIEKAAQTSNIAVDKSSPPNFLWMSFHQLHLGLDWYRLVHLIHLVSRCSFPAWNLNTAFHHNNSQWGWFCTFSSRFVGLLYEGALVSRRLSRLPLFLSRGMPIHSDLSDFPLANSCHGTYVFEISWMCVSRFPHRGPTNAAMESDNCV